MNTNTQTIDRQATGATASTNQIVAGGGGAAIAKAPSFGEELKRRESQFKAALPAQIPLERFMRVVMTAVQRNPDLANADRASLFTSAMQAAQDGLLPDGREGALVIYNTKVNGADGKKVWVKAVQWMPMIAGIRKKVRNSGEIATWDAHVVYARDAFEFELGDDPFIKHRPAMDGDPGEVIAAYSIATLKSGEKSREVMTRAQIESVRSRSKQKDENGNPTGPWKTDYEEMCRKTVARRHSKVLPMSTDLDDLIRRDDDLYDMKGAREEAQIANGGRPQSLASRLDVLANARGREDAPLVEQSPASEVVDHNPETGEVTEGDQSAENQDTTPETVRSDEAGAGSGQPAPATDAPRAALMQKLRGKAERGTDALRRALRGLVPAENEMLSHDDHDALGDIAEAADKTRETA